METNKTILPIQKCIEVALNLRVGVVLKIQRSLEITACLELFYPL